MPCKPRVALIGTGGTITSLGRDSLDLQDYSLTGQRMHPAQVLEMFPQACVHATVVPVDFKAIPSPEIEPADWKALVETIDRSYEADPALAGFVILHGTSTLEETAYALNLLAKVPVPIVLVGAQRPASALSSDAGLNLVNAIRVAADPQSRGLGVLVLLNDEIQAAREVTKTSMYRLQAFQSPDFGALGHVDGDSLNYYRRPIRRGAPNTEFDIRPLPALPRVDIAYSYAGADGAAIEAFVAAGAQGIVSGSLAPGYNAPREYEALQAAAESGVIIVHSSRVGSGRNFPLHPSRMAGFVGADNLNPQKARILLACALTRTRDRDQIARMFATY
ncbi:MAG: asparaginase [Burkholderiaceae bacterium]